MAEKKKDEKDQTKPGTGQGGADVETQEGENPPPPPPPTDPGGGVLEGGRGSKPNKP